MPGGGSVLTHGNQQEEQIESVLCPVRKGMGSQSVAVLAAKYSGGESHSGFYCGLLKLQGMHSVIST